MTKVILFTTPTCNRCPAVAASLTSAGVPFSKVDISTPAGLAELRVLGCFELAAPILGVSADGEKFVFYSPADLLDGDRVLPLDRIDPRLAPLDFPEAGE